MSSSWDVYYVIFLSALLALVLPLTLMLASRLARSRRVGKKLSVHALDEAATPELTSLGTRMNTRVFLSVNAALALICLMLVLVPCVGVVQSGAAASDLVRALFVITSIAGLAALGLLYAAKKNDLSWLRSHQEKPQAEEAP